MSNVYRVNITCPRCRFRGDVECDFPCGHGDLLSRAERAEKERDALLKALAALVARFDFGYLDKGIGSETDSGREWLDARALLNASASRAFHGAVGGSND